MPSYQRLFSVSVIFLILGGIILPLTTYSLSRWNGTGSITDGIPISESIFSVHTSENEKSDVYPDAYRVTSQRPYSISRDYSAFEGQIDNETAISTAQSFLADVGPPLVNWTVQAIAEYDEPPSWKIMFVHVDFTAYIVVDALEGQVIEYESRYLHEYDPTAITLQEAEELVNQFLTDYDIEIPSTARYIEGFPYDCQRFYSLVFQEYLGPIEIEDSAIIVRASAFTHGISYYKYGWIGIDSIDISQVIGYQQALSNALAVYNLPVNTSNQSEESPKLIMAKLYDNLGNIHHRLSWKFEFISEIRDITFYVDAFSGSLFGIRDQFEPYRPVEEQISLWSSEFLLTIPIVSTVPIIVLIITFMIKRNEK